MATVQEGHALIISGGGLRCKGLCLAHDPQAKVPAGALAYGYSSMRPPGRFIVSAYTWSCWACVNPPTIMDLRIVSHDRIVCWSTLPEAAQVHVIRDIVAGRSTAFHTISSTKRVRDGSTKANKENSPTPLTPRKGDPARSPVASAAQIPGTSRFDVRTDSAVSPDDRTGTPKRQKLDASSANSSPVATTSAPPQRNYIQTDKSGGKSSSARSLQYCRTRVLKRVGDAHNPYAHRDKVKNVIRLVAVVDLPALDDAFGLQDVLVTKMYTHQVRCTSR
ncbi:hypothetical protein EXIGLDRAFT_773072 [Exidia glandulosa HHB12029]|uniref:Uncharacterized protein n=1 Tax=Exidia glandulosa HHB12029 TaxID=1314781 RepID=A0A165EZ28_EXIGL|nr:hypothetical protein EXIGLDRAFT_773072 [Exidia glandulosa HHB12029]